MFPNSTDLAKLTQNLNGQRRRSQGRDRGGPSESVKMKDAPEKIFILLNKLVSEWRSHSLLLVCHTTEPKLYPKTDVTEPKLYPSFLVEALVLLSAVVQVEAERRSGQPREELSQHNRSRDGSAHCVQVGITAMMSGIVSAHRDRPMKYN